MHVDGGGFRTGRVDQVSFKLSGNERESRMKRKAVYSGLLRRAATCEAHLRGVEHGFDASIHGVNP
jgi:hypothetical protein